MNQKPENNPVHQPETSLEGKTTFITEDPPGGLPLDSPEVLERERKRHEQLEKNRDEVD